jgi:hypothetical protein
VLDQANLRRLKQTSGDGDWIAASDVALALFLESKGTPDEFIAEGLPRAVRSQDAEWLAIVINELTAPE